MSSEKTTSTKEKKLETLTTPEAIKEKINGRVDINHLLARVRDEKKKENKANISIFIVIVFFVFIAGIILSF